MRPSRDKKGVLVGSNALGPYGTPKCEFILQLLRVEVTGGVRVRVRVKVRVRVRVLACAMRGGRPIPSEKSVWMATWLG